MENVLMISASACKMNGYVNENVEDGMVTQTILRVQDTVISKLLGKKHFDALCKKISDSLLPVPVPLTADDVILLDEYISKCIISAVDYRILNHLRLDVTAKGVVTTNDQFASNTTFEDMNKLWLSNKSDFDHYQSELQSFLCDNATKYPDHIGRCNCTCSRVNSNYPLGIRLA